MNIFILQALIFIVQQSVADPAALSQSKVDIVKALDDQMMEIIEYGGHVEKYTPESIIIEGAYYLRNQYEFRTDFKSSVVWRSLQMGRGY